ncbi:trigger factor [Alicyclobacillus sp. SP_1]|jgi:trigger factor|uniref:trigger factor n=1 Tax=Alicyclobacillus sp. SP_1 TaxID=2942475 RepID=UPI002157D6E6|nr:trigger factor [Alicyclobacillus sp. SP_1]
MTAKWEKTGNNVGVLEVELPSEDFGSALDEAFKSVVKRVNVPGFRKGKVPRKVFESKFGVESLYQEAVDYLLPRAYDAAIRETGIEPVDRPSVDLLQAERGKAFHFKAQVTVKPEVKLGQYKGLEIEDKKFEVTDESLEEELDRIRLSHAQIEVVEDGTVEQGDTVSIDFEGMVNGEPFEGGEAENFELEIGSGMFIAGFEDQLIGMAPMETRKVNVTFPEEYHVKSLSGQPAEFTVVLHDIKRKVMRELDDEFVQEISDFQTVEEFKADVSKSLEQRLEAEHRRYLEDACVALAVANSEIDLPRVMIEHEIDVQVDNFARQLQYQQIPLDAYLEFTGTTMEELRSQFEAGAEERVRTELVIEAIAKAENLNPTEEDITAEVERIANQAQMETDRAMQLLMMRDPGLRQMMLEMRNSKTAEFLVANSIIA